MINLKEVYKEYISKEGNKVIALNNINLSFNDKGLIFIIGKSGSGKTTLLNLIGGLDKCNEGEIIVDNIDITKLNHNELDFYRNKNVGYIFQEYNLIKELNIYDNIAISLELQKAKYDKQKIYEVLKKVDMLGYEKRLVEELSTGQKQRIAIARALVKNPKLILADEPTGALDIATSEQIYKLFKKLANEKLIIVVTHDKEAAYKYGDRVIELRDGEIILDTKGEELNDKKKKIRKS